jgi:hypothetical protein
MHDHLAGDPDDIARGLAETYLGRLPGAIAERPAEHGSPLP